MLTETRSSRTFPSGLPRVMREVILEPASKIERKGFAADPPNGTRVDVAHRPPDVFPADLAHQQLDAPTICVGADGKATAQGMAGV